MTSFIYLIFTVCDAPKGPALPSSTIVAPVEQSGVRSVGMGPVKSEVGKLTANIITFSEFNIMKPGFRVESLTLLLEVT